MYRLMQPSEEAAVVALWQAERGDSAAFAKTALEQFAGVENVYVAEENGRLEAAALAVPVTLRGRSGSYLYGLCGKGELLLAGLVDYLCAQQKLRGAGFTVAVPQGQEQAALLEGLQGNLLRLSAGIAVVVLCLSGLLSRALTRKIGQLLTAIREVREGAYSHRAEVPGRDEIAQLAVQGPLAMRIVQRLCPAADLGKLAYYTFVKTEVAGIADAIVSATGYTGAGGCEIYVANEDAPRLWEALWQAGERDGLQNIGLGARDTLRLEMGYCLYGNDIDDTTSPVEAGLGWITKTGGDRDFIDRPLLERQKREGVSRRLVGFELTERGVPRHGYRLSDAEGRAIGSVTSGTMSPTLKKGIGMGYVETAYAEPGTPIAVVIREKPVAARIVKLPFIPNR